MNLSLPPGPKATTGDIVKPLAAAKGAISAVDAHVDKTGALPLITHYRVLHYVPSIVLCSGLFFGKAVTMLVCTRV